MGKSSKNIAGSQSSLFITPSNRIVLLHFYDIWILNSFLVLFFVSRWHELCAREGEWENRRPRKGPGKDSGWRGEVTAQQYSHNSVPALPFLFHHGSAQHIMCHVGTCGPPRSRRSLAAAAPRGIILKQNGPNCAEKGLGLHAECTSIVLFWTPVEGMHEHSWQMRTGGEGGEGWKLPVAGQTRRMETPGVPFWLCFLAKVCLTQLLESSTIILFARFLLLFLQNFFFLCWCIVQKSCLDCLQILTAVCLLPLYPAFSHHGGTLKCSFSSILQVLLWIEFWTLNSESKC